jgi:hypothetical protein
MTPTTPIMEPETVNKPKDSQTVESNTEPLYQVIYAIDMPFDYVINIYNNHYGTMYVPELHKQIEGKVDNTIRDVIVEIKRGLTNAVANNAKTIAIRAINSRASSLLANALFVLLNRQDSIFADYSIDIGFCQSKYNEDVLQISLGGIVNES